MTVHVIGEKSASASCDGLTEVSSVCANAESRKWVNSSPLDLPLLMATNTQDKYVIVHFSIRHYTRYAQK